MQRDNDGGANGENDFVTNRANTAAATLVRDEIEMLVILSPASPLPCENLPSPLLVVLPLLPSHCCEAVQTHSTSTAPREEHIKIELGRSGSKSPWFTRLPSSSATPRERSWCRWRPWELTKGGQASNLCKADFDICPNMKLYQKQTSKAEFVLRESLLMAEVSTYMEVPVWGDNFLLVKAIS